MPKYNEDASTANNSSQTSPSAHETGILQTFVFNETNKVEIIIINGEPYFVATDVCSVLGLTQTTKALYGLENDEKLPLLLVRSGQKRRVNLVTESGLYSLIFQSRKPEARQFCKWITSEVLPSIRKTGQYSNNNAMKMILSEKDKQIASLQDDNERMSEIIKIQNRTNELIFNQHCTVANMMMEKMFGKG
ncbi:hypothetical protein EZS27_020401 [termite gut metagenome]|uniref:Bro-N domain-containing protein n=1 Tax=termite gut metagenome TaxID=433724 RepID=A0A5J4RDU8_9ZZZZ